MSQVKDIATFSTYFCTILPQFSCLETSAEQLGEAVILTTYQEQYTFAVWSWWVRYVVQRINAVFSCPSDSRLHMMSSTSLQSTFAILKKKIKRKGTLFSACLQKKCMFTVSKEMVSQTHEQNITSPFNTKRPYHTFQLQNSMRSSRMLVLLPSQY